MDGCSKKNDLRFVVGAACGSNSLQLGIQHAMSLCSAVQYSAVYSDVQYREVQYGAVQCGAVQCGVQ